MLNKTVFDDLIRRIVDKRRERARLSGMALVNNVSAHTGKYQRRQLRTGDEERGETLMRETGAWL